MTETDIPPELQELMDRMKSKEPLHPDLVPHMGDMVGQAGWKVLRHPLVYQVPFMSNGQANYTYEIKKKALTQAETEGNWNTFVYLHERPYRLYAFLKIADQMSDQDYWEIASSIWTDSENIHEYYDEWAEVFSSGRKGRNKYFMDTEERKALKAMPDTITIYRGMQLEVNEEGWSFSTDLEKARWFALRKSGWNEGEPMICEATVEKKNVVAYLTGRGESEIIAYPHAINFVRYLEP